ncbi:MAG TPA: FtsX-like permease family protein [Nocardioidaceae bacterium]|nr:FtsX-like permease family protein [Nocardioidaceae bacterium]
MFRTTIRNLLARKLRLALSGFAIVLGVAFVAGSFVFTDTLSSSFDGIVNGTTPDVAVEVKDASDPADPSGAGDIRTIPASVAEDLRSDVDGADRVDGNVTVGNVFVIDQDGKLVGGNGPPSFAVNFNDAPSITGRPVLSIDQGGAPSGAGEIMLDEFTADQAGYEIGDTVPLVTLSDQPRLDATLTGIVKFGEGSLQGATLTVFDTKAMQDLFFDGRDVYTDIWITADDGVSQQELRDEAATVIPDDLVARTGDDVAEESQDDFEEAISFISIFLLVFAGIALIVGTFLIINTFSILVAQRSRELALLRALGASRRQVTRSVLLESFIVGLVGSTIGLMLGFGLPPALTALMRAIGIDLQLEALVFKPRTAIVAYAVGIIVTMIAAYLPARRASRIAPVAALRDDIALPESSIRWRTIIGSIVVVVGAGLMALGLAGSGGSGAALVGLGILFVLLGVAALSPVVGRPVLHALGRLFAPFGMVGRLATQNSLRNPRRTAATASALMIGLALVATMSVLGSSANASIDKMVKENLAADYVISNAIGAPFSPGVAEQAAQVDGVESVASYRAAPVDVDDKQIWGGATDPEAFTQMIDATVVDGSLDDLGGRTVVLDEQTADDLGVSVGETIDMKFPAATEQVEVVATVEQNPAIGQYIVPYDVFDAAQIRPADSYVYILRDPDASATQVRADLEKIVEDVPTVSLKDQEEFADEFKANVNQLLFLIYALLGLAIVIAVLGIINTLALSVIERTREVGLLRAVGMSRRQLRRMVRLESIAIAVLGAVLGVVMGVVFGVVLQRAIADQGLDVLSVPYVSLGVFVLIAAIVGVLAALLPARRAARLDVLRAITTE